MDDLDGTDFGPQLTALEWLLASLSGLFLFTRLYLKTIQKRGLWWDDWILLASWVALTAQASLIAHVVWLGYGKRHIPLANIPRFGFPVNVLSSLLIFANLWGKTSFGVTLLRLPVPWMRVCLWFVMTSLTLTLTASVVLVWITCSPVGKAEGCVPIDASIRYNVFSCVYSAAMDVALALLPWRYLLSLQMSKKEKLGVVVAMSLGLLAGATAAAKATTIPQVEGSDARGSVPLVALGAAEAAVCIMAASIPILRALARGGFRDDAPGEYETGEPTFVTETSSSASLMSPLHRTSWGQRPRHERDRGGESANATAPMATDDEESIELSHYQARLQSPVEFTRSRPV